MANSAPGKPIVRSAVLTDVGMVREHNEDSAHVDLERLVFVVADGMGGHAAGEVASAMAVEAVHAELARSEPFIHTFAASPAEPARQRLVEIIEQAVRVAHRAVFDRGNTDPDKHGMGTTLEVVLVAGAEAFVAHVGDSRTYLIRDGVATQITTDHTVAEVLYIEGKLTYEEAQKSPLRTVLVNAIGVAPEVGVEMAHLQLQAGDQLLLCSDGLHDYFPVEQELADYIAQNTPDAALASLIEIAKDRGGQDNITGIIVDMVECPEIPDGMVVGDVLNEFSDGVPAPIAQDDTLPVDGSDEGGDGADTIQPPLVQRQVTQPGIGPAGASNRQIPLPTHEEHERAERRRENTVPGFVGPQDQSDSPNGEFSFGIDDTIDEEI